MKKLDNKGFTLVELLCTIVIVLLLTACITVGIGTCSKVFGSTFGFAKAQTLSSSLNYLIADELRTATDVETDENGYVTSYKSNSYVSDKAKMTAGDGKALVDRQPDKSEKDEYNPYNFFSSKLYDNLKIDPKTFSITKSGGVFDVSYEIVNASGKVMTSSHFQVKSVEG